MTKQEEIRVEAEHHIRACLKASGIDKDIASSLSSSLMVLYDGLGVVIKVDKELPQDPAGENTIPPSNHCAYVRAQQDMVGKGYAATIPLVEEI